MESISADLWHNRGKDYLVVADRFSGWPWAFQLRSTDAASISSKLDTIFDDFGFPVHARADGGPQFRTHFEQYCKTHKSSQRPPLHTIRCLTDMLRPRLKPSSTYFRNMMANGMTSRMRCVSIGTPHGLTAGHPLCYFLDAPNGHHFRAFRLPTAWCMMSRVQSVPRAQTFGSMNSV